MGAHSVCEPRPRRCIEVPSNEAAERRINGLGCRGTSALLFLAVPAAAVARATRSSASRPVPVRRMRWQRIASATRRGRSARSAPAAERGGSDPAPEIFSKSAVPAAAGLAAEASGLAPSFGAALRRRTRRDLPPERGDTRFSNAAVTDSRSGRT
jgi:hypothetical protein